MIKKYFNIDNIPAILWGEYSNKIFIAIHGNMSNKEDDVIKILASKVVDKGYQVISFDLPEHGERKEEKTPCKVQNCVQELTLVINYVKEKYNNISLFACSMGAYFSLLSYKNEDIKQSLFLSPIVNMKIVIDNMMKYFNVDEDSLEKEKVIETPINQKLYWDYYCYVKKHPIDTWNSPTSILYGSKDDVSDREIVIDFSKRFNCNLTIMNDGEHYFHTKEQLKFFELWIENNIK